MIKIRVILEKVEGTWIASSSDESGQVASAESGGKSKAVSKCLRKTMKILDVSEKDDLDVEVVDLAESA